MSSDGMFSSKVFGDSGIASEKQFSVGDIEAAVDPLSIEGKPFPGLTVEGLGFRVKNRSDHLTRFYPRSAVAIDEFPMRSSNTMIAPNVPEGAFWASEAQRRRRILARSNIAYIPHFSGEPQPTADDLALARAYVEEHRRDRDTEPEPDPLTKVSYERSQTAGVMMDEAAGVGVRIRPDGFDTSESDEAARRARLAAPPMYGPDGEPIDKG